MGRGENRENRRKGKEIIYNILLPSLIPAHHKRKANQLPLTPYFHFERPDTYFEEPQLNQDSDPWGNMMRDHQSAGFHQHNGHGDEDGWLKLKLNYHAYIWKP